MKTFPTWGEAHAWAQRAADQSGLSLGIERPTPYEPHWTVRYLPKKDNRSGWELRCEVVDPRGVP